MLIRLRVCAVFYTFFQFVLPISVASQGNAKSDCWEMESVDISSIQCDRKLLAFTFDDAPASTLEQIVAVFLSYNQAHPDAPASATLFCNGARIHSATAPAVAAATALGFELGNHTQHHYDLSRLTEEELRQEIDRTDQALWKFDKRPLHLLRAPYGRINDAVRLAAKTPIIDWFIDTNDWTGISENEIYDAVWQNKSDGAIVLMHDGYPNTVDALKRLLPDLYEAGYQAVGVSQMAKAHGCQLKVGCVYTRARKQVKIA